MKSLFLAASVAAFAMPATATTITVQATDSVYNYDGSQIAGLRSTTPQIYTIPAKTLSLTFSNSGSVELTPGDSPYGYHGPDGSPSTPQTSMNVSSAASLSGMISPNVGYVAGVFLNGAEGSLPAPATLDFSSAGTGEDFASLTPAVDQVFFIGDGLSGTGSGTVQNFIVPTGATKLVLGIVDGNNYQGAPGAYQDNYGTFTVNVAAYAGAVPEPASWAMMIGGFGVAGGSMRRRRVAHGQVALA